MVDSCTWEDKNQISALLNKHTHTHTHVRLPTVLPQQIRVCEDGQIVWFGQSWGAHGGFRCHKDQCMSIEKSSIR